MRLATYLQAAPVTRGSLLALAMLCLTIALGTSSILTVSLYIKADSAPFVSVLWLALYLTAFTALMFDQGVNWMTWILRYRLLLVVLLIGTVLSIGWSISPWISTERSVHLVGSSLVAIYLGFRLPLVTMLRLSCAMLVVLMLLSTAVAVLVPDLGTTTYAGRTVWTGITGSKNNLGFWAAIAVLLCGMFAVLSMRAVYRLLYLGFGMLSLGVLAMSHSATSLLCLMIGVAVSLYLYIASRFQLGFLQMLVLACLFIGLTALGISQFDTAEIVGRSHDLTGRAEVWRQTWSLILEQPLSGYGYGTIWFPTDATLYLQQGLTDFSWVVYHAHNGFLQVASEIGLPLSCVALLMIAQQLIEVVYCQYQRQQAGALFVLAFLAVYLSSNFTEARFLVNRELHWILFIAMPISMLRQVNLPIGTTAPESRSYPADTHRRRSALALELDDEQLQFQRTAVERDFESTQDLAGDDVAAAGDGDWLGELSRDLADRTPEKPPELHLEPVNMAFSSATEGDSELDPTIACEPFDHPDCEPSSQSA